MRLIVSVALIFATASADSFADRAPYRRQHDLFARGDQLTVRHHHDWSQVPTTDRGMSLHYTTETPFGVELETSNLGFYSSRGDLITRVPSPPLTFLGISADGKYVIGLSNIKYLNLTQLVVFNSLGELLLRRRISPSGYCVDVPTYQELRIKHSQAFSDLDEFANYTRGLYEWRVADSVYLDFGVLMPGQPWTALVKELRPTRCDSPLSENFSQSITNLIFWYHKADPRPRVIESAGQPVQIRLRDPKGIEFGVSFSPTYVGETESATHQSAPAD